MSRQDHDGRAAQDDVLALRRHTHLHAVVALKDGSTKAGHVFEARVAPLAEISVVATSIGGAH